MRVTQHAAKRFLQRVMKMEHFNKRDMYRAYRFLEKETRGIVTQGYHDCFRLPSFEAYRAVVVENTLVTILPKEWRH